MSTPEKSRPANLPTNDAPTLGFEDPAMCDMPSIGLTLGKYRITTLLASGGMGSVFLAEDTVLGRDVAIKVLPKLWNSSKELVERFYREARAAARVNHPNVATVHEIDFKIAWHFIVMELARGRNTWDMVCERGPLPPREATRIIAAAARGLQAAHAAGLVHRDIKPGNILCGEQSVKLCDFGIARIDEREAAKLTATGMILGTPEFMSPEQFRQATVDARSDVYSLGATYFTLLAGRIPFEEANRIRIVLAHREAPIPDPRQFAPDIPEFCFRIVERSMAKNPDDRYQTAEAMAVDLERGVRWFDNPGDDFEIEPPAGKNPTPTPKKGRFFGKF